MLCLGVALLGMPALAAEQNAVLYEVTETMKLKKKKGNAKREARASLAGTISKGTSLCPAALAEALRVEGCSVVVNARDSIDLTTGKGPVTGKIWVTAQDNNPVDAAEVVIATGHIWGRIDLSPAVLSGVPAGTLKGRWRVTGDDAGPLAGLRLEGTVNGVFLLPFVHGVPEGCLDDGNPSDCVYVSKPSYWVKGAPVELGYHEYSLGVPTVRLDATFTETATWFSRFNDD
jgi:hypothetical protein